MRTMLLLFVLIGAGCTNNNGSSDAGPTCSPRTASDGGVFYDCLGGTWPQCPGNEQPSNAPATYGPCGAVPPTCMGCSQGAGFACTCEDGGISGLDAPDAAFSWLCVGTGYTCQ